MSFISHIHAAIRNARVTRHGATMSAHDVPLGMHKTYPRMPQIMLPVPIKIDMALDQAIVARRSFNTTHAFRSFTQQELGTLLGVALGSAVHPLRHYPSGGALFPIETYLIGNVIEKYPPGVFHFNPTSHALEYLWNIKNNFSTHDITTTSGVPTGSALIVFTALWDRSAAKYGDLTYLHGAIEAGHMAQNILLSATALNIPARPIAGFQDDAIAEILDIDTDSEQVVYAVLVAPRATTMHQH